MSNSAKQRSFIRDLITRLKEIGFDVTLEISKNNILCISYKERKINVSISCTPSNRTIAQRKALADIKRSIHELNESIAQKFNPEGLLQMMENNGENHSSNLTKIFLPDYRSLNDSLRASGLDESTINDVINAVTATIENESSVKTKNVQSSSAKVKVSLNKITVLSPHGNIPSQCSQIVTVSAKEQKNRVTAFTLKNALQSLTDYYSHCLPITKLGVVVTDVWRPSDLFIFENLLDYYEAIGIQTFIILKSNARLQPMNFPWR